MSEEEAKKLIYNVCFERCFGFGCQIEDKTSNKLEGLPGVLLVTPDSYVEPEYKDYGGELFVTRKTVQRPPERRKRLEPQPQGVIDKDQPKSDDRVAAWRKWSEMFTYGMWVQCLLIEPDSTEGMGKDRPLDGLITCSLRCISTPDKVGLMWRPSNSRFEMEIIPSERSRDAVEQP